jgi:hypothetical protein
MMSSQYELSTFVFFIFTNDELSAFVFFQMVTSQPLFLANGELSAFVYHFFIHTIGVGSKLSTYFCHW